VGYPTDWEPAADALSGDVVMPKSALGSPAD
jgi:hypothetical protein